jgi:hypothetical protein
MKYSIKKIQCVDGRASKSISFESSPEIRDIIKLDINLAIKNRDTLLNACLSEELDSIDKVDFENHVSSSISCNSYKQRQIIIALKLFSLLNNRVWP